jgi:hypothetical protein
VKVVVFREVVVTSFMVIFSMLRGMLMARLSLSSSGNQVTREWSANDSTSDDLDDTWLAGT